VILRTHPSNFRMTGFTSAPALDTLAHFAHAHGLLLVEDLGGGALVDLAPYGIEGEPTVQASLKAGVDLVLFSGDKLLGGPQAGSSPGGASWSTGWRAIRWPGRCGWTSCPSRPWPPRSASIARRPTRPGGCRSCGC